MAKKFLYILIIAVLGTACSSWSNFRAYYNTYYNAKKSFRSGLNKIEEQTVIIDPAHPVLIHQTPAPAGSNNFQEAVEKGARVLQRYPGSKWIDDALLLIGKSYYYQHKFYPALQKFEELSNSSSSKMQQLAVIWKGKTLLAIEHFDDGANYLESQISGNFDQDPAHNKAKMQILAGEHYAMMGNWDQSAQWLAKAIANIENEKLLGRTLFLYGQVLERSQRYGEAYYAFSQIEKYFPGFEYIYWAAFKKADVSRKQGNMDLAITIYKDLRKDDKNIARKDELIYEIARTLEMKEEASRAANYYENLLNSEQRIQRDLRADIYYRLGKINSDIFNNYPVAAAYFDSSSSLNAENNLPKDADAQALAQAYGKFTSLQKTIQRVDSLLWLSSLSPSKLDSAVKRITLKKRNKLLEQREAESENRLLNQNLNAQLDGNQTISSIYGFLNYRNAELVRRGKAEFRLIWGNRPSVDNWRRIEAVQQSTVSGPSPENIVNLAASSEETAAILDLGFDEIPRTPEERAALQSKKASTQYELGNLLFLKLNSPDSARIYFHRSINSSSEKELQAKSMYSLYELFNSQNKKDSLRFWRRQVLKKFPDSRYAQRIALRGGDSPAMQTEGAHSSGLAQKYQKIIASEKPYKASRLRALALANPSSDLASSIFYRALKEYIKQAKALTKMNHFIAAAVSPDSMQRETGSFFMQQKGDKTYFTNAYWDSVHIVIKEFDTTFANTAQSRKVAKLRKMLETPPPKKIQTCENLGVKLKVKPDMKAFLSTVKYPEKLKGKSISGSISYSFIVRPGGAIESYKLVSNRTSLGIEEAFEAAFEGLSFMPVTTDNPPNLIRCDVAFAIRI